MRHQWKTGILDWLTENDEKVADLLDKRTMPFYVCANWDAAHTAEYLDKVEKEHPGTLKDCVDAQGRNLLWYSLYTGNEMQIPLHRWLTDRVPPVHSVGLLRPSRLLALQLHAQSDSVGDAIALTRPTTWAQSAYFTRFPRKVVQ